MLPTIKYKKDFDSISATGTPIIILKKTEQCDCYVESELLESEPNPYCKKCYGTGFERMPIFVDKIRHEPQTSRLGAFYEETLFNTTINDKRIFFFPKEYGFITTKELIAVLDEDNNNEITALYKVVGKERYNAKDFVYYEIFGKKLNFLPKIEVNDD